jgi:PleD family two-component response regulator
MSDFPVLEANILIVDDQEPNIRLLEFMLESAGYRGITGISDPRRVLAACKERRT